MKLKIVFVLLTTATTGLPFNSLHAFSEQDDRIEIDWSRMRLRYYGEAKVETGQEWSTGEQSALTEGLGYLTENLPKMGVNRGFSKSSLFTSDVAHKIASSTYISGLDLSPDGSVRVNLESAMGIVFAQASEIEFAAYNAEQEQNKHSKLILELSQQIKPMATYELVNQDGDVLLAPTDIARAAFERRMMGRWHSKKESAKVAAGNPFVMKAEPLEGGRLLVDEDIWEDFKDANPGLIREAKIEIILPQ